MRYLLLLLLGGCMETTLAKVGGDSPASQAALQVSPPGLAFGALPEGETAVEAVTLTNVGGAPLSILALAAQGSDDFTLLGAIPGELAPGESREVEVAFTAEALDAAGELWVYSTDPTHPELPVPLTGGAAIGVLLAAPSPLVVGHTTVGGEAQGTLTVTNIGHAPASLLHLYLDRDEFALVSPPALPVTLAPDDVVALDVGFYPDVEGTYEARLWLGSDVEPTSQAITLRGTAGDATDEGDDPVKKDDCYEPEDGFLEHPEARFLVADPTTPITVEYVAGYGAYTNELWVSEPVEQHLFTTHHTSAGATVEVGPFAQDAELMLRIYVQDTSDTFYSGPASRNADDFPHVAMAYLGDCSWRVGFEDLWQGGDQDFDDAVVVVSGGLRLER